ncbi:MAG: hypothetical protein ACI841_001805, partial [Planctomycetota bacterium]
MATKGQGSGRAALVGRILRYAFAIGILYLVVTTVPWMDRLEYQADAAEDARVLTGQISGDWNTAEIEFTVRSLPELPSDESKFSAFDRAITSGQIAAETRLQVDATQITHSFAGDLKRHVGSVSWRPGMPSAFRQLDVRDLMPALGFLILGSIFAVTRWWRLLLLIGCKVRLTDTLRLTYIGLFFNLVLPGLNGGDVARGVLVVRENPEHRANALMSVFVDRMLGLLAMIALATLATFIVGEPLADLRLPVLATLLAVVLGLSAFLNSGVRRLTRFDRIVDRLPQSDRLRKLDRALVEYAAHPGPIALALILSVGNHASVTAAIFSLGRAFGDTLQPIQYLATVTVTNTLTSLPIAPGGWGVGEAAFRTFFVQLGSVATLGVAVSVTYRLMNAALGLAGGIFLLLPSGRAVRAHLSEDPAATELDPDTAAIGLDQDPAAIGLEENGPEGGDSNSESRSTPPA